MVSQQVVLMGNTIPCLREELMTKITDLVSGIPLDLPLLREVQPHHSFLPRTTRYQA
jgi:hypothetical protein